MLSAEQQNAIQTAVSSCPWYLMTFLFVQEDRQNPSERAFWNVWLSSVYLNEAIGFSGKKHIYNPKANAKILVVMTTTPCWNQAISPVSFLLGAKMRKGLWLHLFYSGQFLYSVLWPQFQPHYEAKYEISFVFFCQSTCWLTAPQMRTHLQWREGPPAFGGESVFK